MFLWFAGLSLVIVWLVFRDPAIDHRLVVVGALIPDVADAYRGGAIGLSHSLAAAVVVLCGVMLVTRKRRRIRRRLLAIPIGMFLHLVLDGAWARTEAFWWPAFGWDLPGRLPVLDRTMSVLLAQEALGALALVWCWNTFGLSRPEARRKFLSVGRLEQVAERA